MLAKERFVISRAILPVVMLLPFGFSGCGLLWSVDEPPALVDRGEPAQPPPGTVRYCWEEPMVRHVRQNPGLDSEGKWYHPSYLAIREVRQGKWRPCEPVTNEVTGAIEGNDR